MKKYPAIDGSDQFQAIVFTPNSSSFKAAKHLCICEERLKDYGSCASFSSYELKTVLLNKINLRSDPVQTNEKSQHDPNSVDFVLPDTFCAIAADINWPDTTWFVKVKQNCEAKNTITGDYDIQITAGQEYIEGYFLEKLNTTTKGHLYRLDKKKTFLFHESVVYPFA